MRVCLPLLFLSASLSSYANPIPTGFPNKGALQSGENIGRLIQEHPAILKSVSPAEFQYGTAEMAAALLKIGTWGEALQHQPVWIGDISKNNGGKLARHLTHQRGLDADIAYLVHAHKLTGHRAKRFHDRFTEQFGLQGNLGENFDLRANYLLLEHVVHDLGASEVFVGCGIYDALEAYDKDKPASIMSHLFADKGHEDHFHVRLKCPEGVSQCSNTWWTRPSKQQEEKKTGTGAPKEKYRHC